MGLVELESSLVYAFLAVWALLVAFSLSVGGYYLLRFLFHLWWDAGLLPGALLSCQMVG